MVDVTKINFTGAGVTASVDGLDPTKINVVIPGGGGGPYSTCCIDVDQSGGPVLASATKLNFVGAGVTATNAGGGQVDVTVPGGGAAGVNVDQADTPVLASAQTINFTGPGADVAVDGGDATQANVNVIAGHFTMAGMNLNGASPTNRNQVYIPGAGICTVAALNAGLTLLIPPNATTISVNMKVFTNSLNDSNVVKLVVNGVPTTLFTVTATATGTYNGGPVTVAPGDSVHIQCDGSTCTSGTSLISGTLRLY